jgi:hypothetical protein
MNYRSHLDGVRFGSWSFREVLDRLLAIASSPVKQALKGEPVSHSTELVEKACQVKRDPFLNTFVGKWTLMPNFRSKKGTVITHRNHTSNA